MMAYRFGSTLRTILTFVFGLGVSLLTLNAVAALLQTVDPTPPLDGIIPVGEEADYFITVDYVIENERHMPAPRVARARGQRWLLAVMTLGNNQGEPVRVQRDTLALIDSEGGRHRALPANEQNLHRVLNSLINPGESVHGAVRFRIGRDVKPVAIEWCIDLACEQRLEVPLP